MISSDQRYWDKRRQLEDQRRGKLEGNLLNQLTSIYQAAMEEIQDMLLLQASKHGFEMPDMVADFSKHDREAYQSYIDENYRNLMHDNEYYQQFIKQHFPIYDYNRVDRLLTISNEIRLMLMRKAITANDLMTGRFSDFYSGTYKEQIDLMATVNGKRLSNKIDKQQLLDILKFKWSGDNYSSDLWEDTATLANNLEATFKNAIVSGAGQPGIIKGMKLKHQGFIHQIETLVITEYANFQETATHNAYKETGVEEYEIITAADERVCKVCGKLNHKRFKVGDGKALKDRPPFHARCRCADRPVMPDLPDDIDQVYEEMFGSLLDDFAKDKYGVTL